MKRMMPKGHDGIHEMSLAEKRQMEKKMMAKGSGKKVTPLPKPKPKR